MVQNRVKWFTSYSCHEHDEDSWAFKYMSLLCFACKICICNKHLMWHISSLKIKFVILWQVKNWYAILWWNNIEYVWLLNVWFGNCTSCSNVLYEDHLWYCNQDWNILLECNHCSLKRILNHFQRLTLKNIHSIFIIVEQITKASISKTSL